MTPQHNAETRGPNREDQYTVMFQAARQHLIQHPEAAESINTHADGTIIQSNDRSGTQFLSAVVNSTLHPPDPDATVSALRQALGR